MGQLGGKQDADKSSSVVGGALVVITDAVVIVVVTAVVSWLEITAAADVVGIVVAGAVVIGDVDTFDNVAVVIVGTGTIEFMSLRIGETIELKCPFMVPRLNSDEYWNDYSSGPDGLFLSVTVQEKQLCDLYRPCMAQTTSRAL